MSIRSERGGQATRGGALIPVWREGGALSERQAGERSVAERRQGGTVVSRDTRCLEKGRKCKNKQNKASNDATASTVAPRSRTVNDTVDFTVKRRFLGSLRWSVILCLLLAAGIAAMLTPALRAAWGSLGGALDGGLGRSLGVAVGRLLLTGGLPPTDALPGLGKETTAEECTEADGRGSEGDEVTAQPGESPVTDRLGGESEEVEPSAPDTETDVEPGDTVASEPGSASPGGDPGGSVPNTGDTSGMDTFDPGAGEMTGGSGGSPAGTTDASAATQPGSGADAEEPTTGGTDTAQDPGASGRPGDPGAQETASASIPDGCFPIISRDLCEEGRGAGYLHNEAGSLPNALPGGTFWPQGAPTVLVVHTHPYEGYGDGGIYYDPTDGALGVVDSPFDADGVVELGTRLVRALRGQGLTVIHLRVSVAPGETGDAIYARTAALVRYYCRLYPDIGLVLDLGRSAEMTADGGILRTEGTLHGTPTAQVRLTVSGGRSTEAVARDLQAALTLRERLWAVEPSLSRPVRVREGAGLAGDAGLDSDGSGPVALHMAFGSAGNTFAEAARLVGVMAEAIGEMVLAGGG